MTGHSDAVARIERGVAAYRAKRRRRLNATSAQSTPADDDIRYLDGDVPPEAQRLRREYPDVRREFDTVNARIAGYDDRAKDLGELIRAAAMDNLDDLPADVEIDRTDGVRDTSGAIVDLGDGTYEMSSTVKTTWSGDSDLLGVVGDDATIHYTGTHLKRLFHLDPAQIGVIEGVTFDISESTPDGYDSDVGIINARFTSEFWGRDVTLAGRRNRFQDIDGDGRKEAVGDRHTWMVQLAHEDGAGYIENLTLPDGEVNHTEEDVDPDGFGGSIPVATDSRHNGLVVYRDCSVERFTDNGFYMSYIPDADETGRAVLWDCRAADVRGGCMRIGENDRIVGGTVRMENPPAERRGQGLVVDRGSGSRVIGLECIGRDYSAELIAIRKGVEETTLDRVVVDADHELRPIRCSSTTETPNSTVTFEECYVKDAYDGPNDRATMLIRDADVTADDLRIYAADNASIAIQYASSDGTVYDGSLTVDGRTYDHDDDLEAELSLEDPRPLPSFGFEN